jgi:hypothetical protein
MLQVVPDAGHSANEVGIAAELRSATEKLRDLLSKWAGERQVAPLSDDENAEDGNKLHSCEPDCNVPLNNVTVKDPFHNQSRLDSRVWTALFVCSLECFEELKFQAWTKPTQPWRYHTPKWIVNIRFTSSSFTEYLAKQHNIAPPIHSAEHAQAYLYLSYTTSLSENILQLQQSSSSKLLT